MGDADEDDDKPSKGLVYSVRDVGPEVLGRVPIRQVPTPKTGVPRRPTSEAVRRATPPATPLPATAARPVTPTPPRGRPALRTDTIRASVEAPRTAPDGAPTSKPLSLYDRALPALKALRSSGPGDEGPSVQALLKLGPAILELVEADFPGLLWFHRHLAHRKLPAGRDVGPLGALLVAYGEAAVPTVVRLLETSSSDARYYASLVASDLLHELRGEPAGRLVAALSDRLFDGDSGVRDVSLHALMSAGEHAAVEEVRERLRTYAVDLGAPLGTRITALRALGVLRRGEVVPDVIPLLDDREEQIRENAHRVLRLLCATDLGGAVWRWRRWWKKHAGEPRVEWLLEGLDSGDAPIRTLAQKEIARVTGHDEPVDLEASRSERKRVRKVYEALVRKAR
jgi:hypothetical protein